MSDQSVRRGTAGESPGEGGADPGAAMPWVALGVFAVYAWLTAPTPYLLDSAELAAASFGLGVAHPPGEALALLWGRAFAWLPLGSVAFRVGLAQAAAGAVAAGLVYRITLDLVAALDEDGALCAWTRGLLATTATLGFALGPGTVLVSNRPEVYALQTALSLGALAAARKAAESRDPRWAAAGALLVGLGGANHPLIALATAPAVLVGAWPALIGRDDGARAGRVLALLATTGLAGALVLVYLPARALAMAVRPAADAIAWGDARTLDGLWWLLSAKTFTGKASVVHTAASPEAFPFAIMEEVGPALALAFVAGSLLALRRARRVAVTLLLAFGGAAAAALWAGFDPGNPDIRGYLGVGLATAAVLGAAGLTPLAAALGRWRGLGLSAALLVATAAWAVPPPPRSRLQRAEAADEVVGDLLTDLPVRAALLTSHFETAFLVAYQRLVEGRRPDVAWSHLGFARGPGYADRVAAAVPELAPVLAAHRSGAVTVAAARAVGRPIATEPDEHLAAELRDRLVPAGHVWRLETGGGTASPGGFTSLPEAALDEAEVDRQVRGFLAWRAYQDAALACARGLERASQLRLAEVGRLLPEDLRARAMAARCGPEARGR